MTPPGDDDDVVFTRYAAVVGLNARRRFDVSFFVSALRVCDCLTYDDDDDDDDEANSPDLAESVDAD